MGVECLLDGVRFGSGRLGDKTNPFLGLLLVLPLLDLLAALVLVDIL